MILQSYLLIIFMRICECPCGNGTFPPRLLHLPISRSLIKPHLSWHLEKEPQENGKSCCSSLDAPLNCLSSPGRDHPGRPLLVCSCFLLPLQAICSCHNKDQRGWNLTSVKKRTRQRLRGAVCKLNRSGQNKDLSFYLYPSHFTHVRLLSSAYFFNIFLNLIDWFPPPYPIIRKKKKTINAVNPFTWSLSF